MKTKAVDVKWFVTSVFVLIFLLGTGTLNNIKADDETGQNYRTVFFCENGTSEKMIEVQYANFFELAEEGVYDSEGLLCSSSDFSYPKSGYSITSWNTEPDGTGGRYDFGSYTNEEDQLTLYAQWEFTGPFKVTFHDNIPGSEATIESDYWVFDSFPFLFEREGYRQVAWNSKPDGSGDDYTYNYGDIQVTEDLDLYAQWAKIYHVTVHELWNGEDKATTIEAAGNLYVGRSDVWSSGCADSLILDTHEGEQIKCFNTKADGSGITYDLWWDYPITGDMEIYTIWEKIYTVTLYGNVPGTDQKLEILASGEFLLAEFANKDINEFVYDGYEVVGWNTKADGSGTAYKTTGALDVQSDVALYAQWGKVSHLIVHKNLSYDDEIVEMDVVGNVEVTRTGFWPLIQGDQAIFDDDNSKTHILSWNTKADGSGEKYEINKSYYFPEELELFAQWGTPYYVTLLGNDEDSSRLATLEVASAIVFSKDSINGDNGGYYYKDLFNKEGYSIGSWNTKPDGTGTEYGPDAETEVHSDLKLYAQWVAIPVLRLDHKNAAPDAVAVDGKAVKAGDYTIRITDGNIVVRFADGFIKGLPKGAVIEVIYPDETISAAMEDGVMAFVVLSVENQEQEVPADGSSAGTPKPVELRISGDPENLEKVIVGDVEAVEGKDYTVGAGSTVITLKESFLASLPKDEKLDVEAVFTDGIGRTNIMLKKLSADTKEKDDPSKEDEKPVDGSDESKAEEEKESDQEKAENKENDRKEDNKDAGGSDKSGSGTNGSGGSKASGTSPRTGDSTNTIGYMALLLIALLCGMRVMTLKLR
ncbi:MAG: hypothetical protein E7240_04205 [Lachnospiraceae bacterium]|nr:hypothetical protein [Lachnospiraceae bacterium]